MRSAPIKIARYLGGWLAVVISVSFLTFAFSLPGTILCAVGIGMMVGGTRHSRWQALPVALVFPGVVFILLRSSKSDLLQDRIPAVALLCFGTFWVTYALTALMISMEAKQPAPKQATEAVPRERGGSFVAAIDGRQAGLNLSNPGAAMATRVDLSSQRLQGRWICQGDGEAAQTPARRLEILDGQLVVSGLGPDGQVRWLAQGRLRIEGSVAKVLVVSAAENSPVEIRT